MQPERLLTTTLRAHPHGTTLAAIMAAALTAVEPGAAVRRALRRDGSHLYVGAQQTDLAQIERVWVVGAGKAGAPMAAAASALLGDKLAGGLVVVKEGHLDSSLEFRVERAELSALPNVSPGTRHATRNTHNSQLLTHNSQLLTHNSQLLTHNSQLTLAEAGHPLPDARGVAATRQMIDLLGRVGPDDLVLALISGGGSALLTCPVAGVSLADMQALTGLLLACGATINQINTLRKHLDVVKGGGLARLAAPARVVTLALSDVVGDPLDIIASGPTVPDPSSFADAYAVLEGFALLERTPVAIIEHLQRGMAGALPETPKPDDPIFARVYNQIIGSNHLACAAALEAATSAGFTVLEPPRELEGEARAAGELLGRLAAAMEPRAGAAPQLLVLGGETTVTLRGNGMGGRNQELALAAVAPLAGAGHALLVTLATDGGDGPTDAAGAVVSGETMARAAALGLEPAAHLADNNAYPFFAALGDLLKPGPTQTNVNDLALVLVS